MDFFIITIFVMAVLVIILYVQLANVCLCPRWLNANGEWTNAYKHNCGNYQTLHFVPCKKCGESENFKSVVVKYGGFGKVIEREKSQ